MIIPDLLFFSFHNIRSLFLIVTFLLFSLCNSQPALKEGPDSGAGSNLLKSEMQTHSMGVLKYDLNTPDEKYVMPESLVEISGLAYYTQDRILCIQDEKANIYVYNVKKRDVENKYKFGQHGDYEDIAVVNQTAYVIRSDGEIFEVKNFESDNRKTTELTTQLTRKNNTEGMAYDKLSNSLFIVCKGSPEVKKSNLYEGYRAVYQFDLKKKKLKKEPAFLIDLHNLYTFRDAGTLQEKTRSVFEKPDLVKGDTIFKPSGIAIHPLTNQIYLISHIGEKLIIMNRLGEILSFHDLSSKIFQQPEGICFSPAGDLFISSEGRGGEGYILKFKMKRDK
jgi:uncharacterized protein YjiK